MLPYATALLASGETAADVVARIEREVGSPCRRRSASCSAPRSIERGEAAAAADQFERVIAQQPGSARGRVALADALLSQRRWAEAATAAAAVGEEDPLAPTARRSELFARIADGDLDGAAAILARDEELRDGDRELFGAWLAAARGERDERPLPAAAVTLLDVILEALLRVEEIDLFAQLVPLLDRTPSRRACGASCSPACTCDAASSPPPRRSGWPSASASPTCRRSLGLAQVAAAQGMTEEALDFAREACSLDPDDGDAARALARLEPLAA